MTYPQPYSAPNTPSYTAQVPQVPEVPSPEDAHNYPLKASFTRPVLPDFTEIGQNWAYHTFIYDMTRSDVCFFSGFYFFGFG